MSNTDKYRNRLINLLKELFQLDQPELDFGFYKIMHAKSVQISRFLEDDLLDVIKDAFGEVDEQRLAEAKARYKAAIEQAKKFGAPDPEQTDGVKEPRPTTSKPKMAAMPRAKFTITCTASSNAITTMAISCRAVITPAKATAAPRPMRCLTTAARCICIGLTKTSTTSKAAST